MDRSRSFAYLCPQCRELVVGEKSDFALNASRSELSCSCGKSRLTVEPLGDHYRMTVPCAFCGEDHTVDCASADFWEREALAFSCKNTGVYCCFLGSEETVRTAASNLEETAAKLQREQAEEGAPGAFLDERVMYEVLSELKDIAGRGGISCACGSASVSVCVHPGAVDLLCQNCGGTLRIPAATDADLDNLCCQMKLQIKGREA